MNIYKYKKHESNRSNYMESFHEPEIIIDKEYKLTIWKVFGKLFSGIERMANSSRIANLAIPSFFIIIGSIFIYMQIQPEIQSFIIDKTNAQNFLLEGTVSPVESQYIDLSQYISNPAGLSELAAEAFNSDTFKIDEVSKNFTGTFFISIPRLGIDKLPVQANIDSTKESVYKPVLSSSLAHFKNTGLPISDANTNMVIYGHSASAGYNPQPNDPEVAFSFLKNLKVGDEINIEINDKTYSYKMQRSRIVEPSDVSIITGNKGKKTLTLFTCYPDGSNSFRYVALARPV